MTPLARHETAEKDNSKTREVRRSRESSVDGDVPHYMTPLDRTLRTKSPHKENFVEEENATEVMKTTKFGVTLKRTDSGRVVQSDRRKSSATTVEGKELSETDIEEIYDLEYLEKLV